MKNVILAALLLLPAATSAGPYSGASISTTTGIQTNNLSGKFNIAASSATSSTYTIVLDGVTGNVVVGSSTGTSKLTVVNGDIRISTTSGSRGIIFQDGTSQITAAAAASVVAGTWTERAGGVMTYHEGNIGIGLTSPNATLHVDGSLLFQRSGGGGSVLDIQGGAATPTTQIFVVKVDSNSTVTPGFAILEEGRSQFFVRETGDVNVEFSSAPAITSGGALCISAARKLSKCTTQPDASGNCTCP